MLLYPVALYPVSYAFVAYIVYNSVQLVQVWLRPSDVYR
jgi:hypothetical protein